LTTEKYFSPRRALPPPRKGWIPDTVLCGVT